MLSPSHLTTRRPVGFVDPCLPTLAHAVPDGSLWVHEIKHDGYRFICRRDGDRVRLFTRRGHDWTDRVPRIAEALAVLPVTSATIDGEAVVCDSAGVSYQTSTASAQRWPAGARPRSSFNAFDLLELDGCDLRHDPWNVRRETLASLPRKASNGIRLSEHIDGANGTAVFRHACVICLEGIVAKRRDRPYWSGRLPDWIKVKNPNASAATRIMER